MEIENSTNNEHISWFHLHLELPGSKDDMVLEWTLNEDTIWKEIKHYFMKPDIKLSRIIYGALRLSRLPHDDGTGPYGCKNRHAWKNKETCDVYTYIKRNIDLKGKGVKRTDEPHVPRRTQHKRICRVKKYMNWGVKPYSYDKRPSPCSIRHKWVTLDKWCT